MFRVFPRGSKRRIRWYKFWTIVGLFFLIYATNEEARWFVDRMKAACRAEFF